MPAPTKSFTVIADAAIDPDSPLDTTLMTALRDNDLHLEEWLGMSYTAAQDHDHDGTNSKSVVLANASVAQAKLKTTTAANSTSIGAGLASSIALTGGSWSMFTFSADTASAGNIMGFGNGNTAAGTCGYKNTDSVSKSAYVDERLIQASPPYNNGPLFIYALMRSNGTIHSVSVGPDPIWAYHGPTDITPDFLARDGTQQKLLRCIDGVPLALALRNPVIRRGVMDGSLTPMWQVAEISLDYKDADKDIIPHPWALPGNDFLSEVTPIIIAPGSLLCERLHLILEEMTATEVRNLILDGHLQIDNTQLAIPNLPAALMAVDARFKLTQ